MSSSERARRPADRTSASTSIVCPANRARDNSRSSPAFGPRSSQASLRSCAATAGSIGAGCSPRISASYMSARVAFTVPLAASIRWTVSDRFACSHSRSTRLARRIRASAIAAVDRCTGRRGTPAFRSGVRPARSSPAARATGACTSIATRNSPSRTPLSSPMTAPEPDASRTDGEPGDRRCATRSG